MNGKNLTVIIILSLMLFTPILFTNSYAQTTVVRNSDIALGGQNNKVFSMEAMKLFVAVSTVSGQQFNTMSYLRSDVIHSPSGAGIKTVQIEPYVGGCNSVDNPCAYDGGGGYGLFGTITTADESTWTGQARGLWCGLTDCFTWWISANTTFPHQLQRWSIESTNDDFVLTGYLNVSSVTYTPRAHISGIDTATGGIGGITVNTIRDVSAGEESVYWTGGTTLMQDVGTPHQLGSAITNTFGMYSCHPFSRSDDNCPAGGKLIVVRYASGTQFASIRILDYDTHNQDCDSSGWTQTVQTAGYATWDNSRTQFVVTANNGNRLIWISLACAFSFTSSLTLQNYAVGMAIDEDAGLYYVHHSSTASPTVIQADLVTNRNTLVEFDSLTGSSISGWVSSTAPTQSIAIDRNTKALIMTGGTSTARIIYLTSFVGVSTGDNQVCIDTNHDGIPNVCYTDTDGDGIPDSSPLTLITNNQPLTTIGFNLLCQINVYDGFCDTTDIKTNGVGYMYWFFLWVFLGGIAFAIFGQKSKDKVLGDMNQIVIISTLVASSFIAYAWQWIDFTLPVIFIIAICGFAAKQLVGHINIRGRGDD